MPKYNKPQKRVHRGFFYLNDDIVTNSLSAIEAGKIDEVVEKINHARAGGFGVGVGAYGAKVEADKKTSSELEEQLVRTRTRFSVFEAWYKTLEGEKAIGTFEGWGEEALNGVEPGDTIKFRAALRLNEAQTLFYLFLWFIGKAKEPGNPYSQTGPQLKALKESEKVVRVIMGDNLDDDEFLIRADIGGVGPVVAMVLARRWMMGEPGMLSGRYSVVAQVEQVLTRGEEYPVMRLTRSAPPTPLEISTLRKTYSGLSEAKESFGLKTSEDDVVVRGPAVLVTPIAIFR